MRNGKPKFTISDLREPERFSQIVHKIGHEIGNPLTSIISLSTLFERSFESETPSFSLPREKIHSYAQAIQSEAWRISALNERYVLLFSNRVGVPSHAPLKSVLCEAWSAAQKSLETSGITVENVHLLTDGIAGNAFVWIDVDQLRWALRALLENALYATSFVQAEASSARVIACSTIAGKDELTLSISNLRETPAPHPLDDLFDPFFSEWSNAKRPGLGLTTAYAIAERAGGTIRIEEEPQAHRFIFRTKLTLPVHERKCATPSPSSDSGRRSPPTSEGVARWQGEIQGLPNDLTLYIVEDDASVGSAMKKILELILAPLTKSCVTVVSGEAFLEVLQAGSPWHATLCDLNLGAISGRYIFEQLELNHSTRRPNFAFLTGDRLHGETLAFLESSGCRYLLKPFEVDDLMKLIIDLVRTPSGNFRSSQ